MKRFATPLAVAALALSVGCSDDDDSGASGICGQIDALLRACGLAYTLNYGCPEPTTEYEICVSSCYARLTCDELILGGYCGDNGAILPGTEACYDACDALEFTCGDSSTIPASWECDFEEDCSDGSDEDGCPAYVCDDGERIPLFWECDGIVDCSAGEDEEGCPDRAIFTCRDGTTISIRFACDNVQHCPDGSDEGNTCWYNDVCP
jgi:hypothetical protein